MFKELKKWEKDKERPNEKKKDKEYGGNGNESRSFNVSTPSLGPKPHGSLPGLRTKHTSSTTGKTFQSVSPTGKRGVKKSVEELGNKGRKKHKRKQVQGPVQKHVKKLKYQLYMQSVRDKAIHNIENRNKLKGEDTKLGKTPKERKGQAKRVIGMQVNSGSFEHEQQINKEMKIIIDNDNRKAEGKKRKKKKNKKRSNTLHEQPNKPLDDSERNTIDSSNMRIKRNRTERKHNERRQHKATRAILRQPLHQGGSLMEKLEQRTPKLSRKQIVEEANDFFFNILLKEEGADQNKKVTYNAVMKELLKGDYKLPTDPDQRAADIEALDAIRFQHLERETPTDTAWCLNDELAAEIDIILSN